ncbi:MAG: hypothetical protein R6V49_01085 [Bacteroidales bacterium]
MMVHLNAILVVFLAVQAIFSGPEKKSPAYAPSASQQGTVAVKGSSNVNEFRLDATVGSISVNAGDYQSGSSGKDQQKRCFIKIPVKDFKTDNQMIYRDFLEMVKSKQHPDILIGIDYSFLEKVQREKKSGKTYVEVNLAGVSRIYEMCINYSGKTGAYTRLSGSETMKLTDFKLNPPQRIFGIVRVSNEIIVNFDFVYRIQP